MWGSNNVYKALIYTGCRKNIKDPNCDCKENS